MATDLAPLVSADKALLPMATLMLPVFKASPAL